MSQYQLIAFDMDGTLLNSNKQISPETLNAIKRATDAGKTVILCTGRNLAELNAFTEIIPGLRYLDCVSGACVYGVLDMINRSTKISEKQTELTYILVDYLEDSVVVRENGHMEKPGNENIVQEKQSETSTNNKEFESDEQILNQVIGEFLQ